jgi:tetratricopeptide (TPR) repeat protein
MLLSDSLVNAQDDKRIVALMVEADALIADNNYSGALAKTKEALAISADYHPALQKEINILILMNDQKESLERVEEAVKKYSDIADYHYLRGIVNNAREKYSKALDDFTNAIDLKPGGLMYRCYLGRGVSYMNLLEYDNALQDLSTSISLNDTVAGTWYSRAMVNYELDDYTAAIHDFQKTLEFSEGSAALYFNMGMSYYRLNEKEKACPNFNKSCSMGNTNACRMSLMQCAKAIPTIR